VNNSRILGYIVFVVFCLIPYHCISQSSSQIYINEINYRAIEKQQNIDFVEIYNPGIQSVDLSNWFLTGGLDYTFPSGVSINGGAYLVIAANPSQAQSVFGVSGLLGPWTGKLSSSEDKVVLRTSDYEVIDRVDYKSWKEWPNVRFNDYQVSQPIPQNTAYSQNVTIKESISIQKINPLLDGGHGGSWSAAVPTPKQQNSNYSSNSSLPVVKSVTKSPDKPTSSQGVRIKVDFDKHELYSGNLNVTLQYQINNAGSYKIKSDANYNSSFISIPMLDDGIAAMSGDSTANNGVYTATISAKQNRALIRYKIKVESTNGYVRYFPDPNHQEDNYSYYVYNGDADFQGNSIANLDTMQNITILTKSSITQQYISTGDDNLQYDGYDYLGEGTLIYNGKIFDHINFRPRGKTRNNRIKPGIKFKMNKEKGILIENDCGKDYNEERDNLVLSGTWVNDEGSHGLVESLIYKILELTKGWYNNTDYVNLRIVDSQTETGLSGDFWGLFLIIEDNNGELLKEHDLPDGNIWTTYDPVGNPRFMFVDYFGNFTGYDDPTLWITDTGGNIPETPAVGTVNNEMFFGDWIGNEFWANGESNYYKKHSYREYYNPETDKWIGWCKDYDGAFGSGNNVTGVSTTNNSDPNFNISQPLNIPSSLNEEYKSALRSAIDLLLNTEQIDFLVDSELKKIYNPAAPYDWTTLDHARWAAYQTYHEGNVDLQFDWYKTWFQDRKSYLLTNSNHGVFDNLIPTKPTISLSGSTALNNMKFTQSNFNDGSGSFAALEWRVGEWSDPSNPIYADKCEPKYEIETVWASGEINSFSNTFTIPPEAKLKVGRTYKVRVRHKDNTGKWSHWSDPIAILPTAASAVSSNLVINEIMYNPAERYTEFIEIHNTGGTVESLDNVKFSNGIDYNFPLGSSILANEYIIIAEDSIEFYNIHGFYPFGEYKSSLSNKGEYVELQGPFRVILDSLTYDDGGLWPATADNGYYSLAFKETQIDNALPENWGIQSNIQTPGQMNEFNNLGEHNYSGLVINEIHYNPFDSTDASNGDLIKSKNFQFIELKNIGAVTIDLSGVFFSQGIDYYFPEGAEIDPGDFIVLAEDKSSFEDRYGFQAYDKYDNKLNDQGETIWLNDETGLLLDAVTYDVAFPWDMDANGGATDQSLALIDGEVDNDTHLNWMVQCNTQYTPGAENVFPCFNGLNYDGLTINEFHYNAAGGNNDEFVEIANHSNSLLNLERVAFTSGIAYVFDYKLLPPNGMIVLAKNATSFQNKYGFAPYDVYTGNISSGGETLTLKDLFANTIDQVSYSISAPWPIEPNQGNYSLGLISGSLNNNLAESWCIQEVFVTPNAANVFGDADNDSVIDCKDQCPGQADSDIGTSCNDNDPCTIGETYDGNCNCTGGVFQDSDNDGVCDAQDQCPNFDDQLIGQSCNDGNACTIGEVYDTNCNCSGGTFQDSDNDGICDAQDSCPNFDNSMIFQPCDDGDACTVGEAYDTNCNCSGGAFQDSDSDGVCDAEDSCPNFDNGLIGQPCNDGDICTSGEIYDSNCNCTGGAFQDNDNDETCDALDNSCNLIDFENFESGVGMWQSNGGDAARVSSTQSPGGNYSFRIRDNSGILSSFSSSVLDLTGNFIPEVSFSFKSSLLGSGEDFFFEVSTDGGTNFQQLKQWVQGVDFVNGSIYQENINIPTNLISSTVVLRFRCNASINSDEVFIDNLKIDACPECEVLHVQSDNGSIDQSRFVQSHIESNGVLSTGQIEFVAEDYILMNAGFEVQLGPVFHAYIEPCSN